MVSWSGFLILLLSLWAEKSPDQAAGFSCALAVPESYWVSSTINVATGIPYNSSTSIRLLSAATRSWADPGPSVLRPTGPDCSTPKGNTFYICVQSKFWINSLILLAPNLFNHCDSHGMWWSLSRLQNKSVLLCVVAAKAAFTAHKWVHYSVIRTSKFWIPGPWSVRKNMNCSYLNSIIRLNVPSVTMDTKPALDQVAVKLI